MNPIQRSDSFEVGDYTGVLRRRWLIVLALTIFGAIGAFGYVTVAPKTYTATSAVFVAPTAADQGGQLQNSRTGGGSVNLDTEAQVVQSTAVATIAAKMLHSPLTPWKLTSQIAVTVPPNSQVLDIACSAPTPTGAETCANDFANAYLQNRNSVASTWVNQQVNALTNKANALQKTVTGLKAKIASLPSNSTTRLNDEATVSTDVGTLHSYTSRIASLEEAGANSSGGHIITQAGLPTKPSNPKKSVVLPSGVVAGLLLGLIAAFVWDRRDKRIHGAKDVERFLDLPVMLNLPPNTFNRQVAIASPRSRTGQEFSELSLAVTAALGEGNHVLLVVGVSPSPGGSVVAASLAAVLARTHPEVVLVCADLNGTIAPDLLGLHEEQGLAEIMAGTATVRDVACGPAGLPGLWVIPPGSGTSRASYYVQHDRAHSLISQLRRDARYVIIEAEASDGGADTFAFAEFADAAVITVETSRTNRDEAIDTLRRLHRLRTPVVGAAVLPALSRRVKVTPPRQGQPQLGAWSGDSHDGAAPRRGDGTPAGADDRRGRAGRSPDRPHDPADRVPGR
jgi:capsular polysaccharide biosynthesis protein/Mrp family chromosome partitioning ATPase